MYNTSRLRESPVPQPRPQQRVQNRVQRRANLASNTNAQASAQDENDLNTSIESPALASNGTNMVVHSVAQPSTQQTGVSESEQRDLDEEILMNNTADESNIVAVPSTGQETTIEEGNKKF